MRFAVILGADVELLACREETPPIESAFLDLRRRGDRRGSRSVGSGRVEPAGIAGTRRVFRDFLNAWSYRDNLVSDVGLRPLALVLFVGLMVDPSVIPKISEPGGVASPWLLSVSWSRSVSALAGALRTGAADGHAQVVLVAPTSPSTIPLRSLSLRAPSTCRSSYSIFALIARSAFASSPAPADAAAWLVAVSFLPFVWQLSRRGSG